jgi:hypothetical protein
MAKLVARAAPVAGVLAALFASAALHGQVPRDRCDATSVSSLHYSDTPTDTVTQAVRPGATFTPDAVITCHSAGTPGPPRRNIFYQVETGEHRGYAYSVHYTNGSASIRDQQSVGVIAARPLWAARCQVDPMDDTRSCRLSHAGALYMVYLDGESRWRVYVGDGNTYPGSEISIRLGDGEVLSATEPRFSDVQSAQIVDVLLAEPRVRTRYSRWPGGERPVGDFEARGFAAAVDLIRWLAASLADD